jgi:hypothetical protein
MVHFDREERDKPEFRPDVFRNLARSLNPKKSWRKSKLWFNFSTKVITFLNFSHNPSEP